MCTSLEDLECNWLVVGANNFRHPNRIKVQTNSPQQADSMRLPPFRAVAPVGDIQDDYEDYSTDSWFGACCDICAIGVRRGKYEFIAGSL